MMCFAFSLISQERTSLPSSRVAKCPPPDTRVIRQKNPRVQPSLSIPDDEWQSYSKTIIFLYSFSLIYNKSYWDPERRANQSEPKRYNDYTPKKEEAQWTMRIGGEGSLSLIRSLITFCRPHCLYPSSFFLSHRLSLTRLPRQRTLAIQSGQRKEEKEVHDTDKYTLCVTLTVSKCNLSPCNSYPMGCSSRFFCLFRSFLFHWDETTTSSNSIQLESLETSASASRLPVNEKRK